MFHTKCSKSFSLSSLAVVFESIFLDQEIWKQLVLSYTSEVSEMVEMLNELKFTNPPPHAKKLRKISLVGKENSNCESVCPSVRSREEVK